jgi:hypothetical protein
MTINENNTKRIAGVTISGGTVNVGGDVFGGDKTTYNEIRRADLDKTFDPVAQSVAQNADAKAKLEDLKSEAAKGIKAEDSQMAKLVDSILKLVPSAVSALVGAFGSPLLTGIAGPVTKYVLEKVKQD